MTYHDMRAIASALTDEELAVYVSTIADSVRVFNPYVRSTYLHEASRRLHGGKRTGCDPCQKYADERGVLVLDVDCSNCGREVAP